MIPGDSVSIAGAGPVGLMAALIFAIPATIAWFAIRLGTPAQVAENGVGASAEYLAAALKLIVAAT